MSAGPYAIGSDHLPGLSKLIEEMGEAGQVAGKIIGVGHMGDHWDGSNLKRRLEEEIADVMAATNFVVERNGLDHNVIVDRVRTKLALFDKWHAEASAERLPPVRDRRMSIKPIFAWYDLWIGAFWDGAKRRLYVFPVPRFGLLIQFPQVKEQGR